MNFSIQKTDPHQEPEYNLILELTMKTVPFLTPHFELEILEGKVSELPDGRVLFQLNVSEEKMNILKKALVTVLFNLNDN